MQVSKISLRLIALVGLTAGSAMVSTSCQSTSESAGAQALAVNVGIYPPPAPGIPILRVGVPPMEMGSSSSKGMEELAADQLSTLLVRTDRFDVIERNQLDKLLTEQDLEGIVAAEEMAGMAQVRGVDYLMIGKITNLRIKQTKTGGRSGFGRIVNITTDRLSGGIGGLDIDNEKLEIKFECGVDLRLVDPTTGSTLAANFSEYTRSDKASAFGVQVLGIGAEAEADIDISEDDKGLILRLALDDCIRGMLPSIDRKLRARAREASAPREE